MWMRLGCLAVSVGLLTACSNGPQPNPLIPPSVQAISAPLQPMAVSQNTINAVLKNAQCNYAQYPLGQGQYMARSCVNAWVLSVTNQIYQQQFQALTGYLTADGTADLQTLKQNPLFQAALNNKVTIVGSPIMMNQGVADDNTYAWVIKVPVLVQPKSTSGTSAAQPQSQLLILTLTRSHQAATNGVIAKGIDLKPLNQEQISRYVTLAQHPYLPVQQLYAVPYAQPIYLDNPTPAKVDIFRNKELLFSQWLPEGPQAINTQDFPAGQYQVEIIMSNSDGQFLRQYSRVIDKQ